MPSFMRQSSKLRPVAAGKALNQVLPVGHYGGAYGTSNTPPAAACSAFGARLTIKMVTRRDLDILNSCVLQG